MATACSIATINIIYIMKFSDVFNFENLYKSALKSCNGVRWKTSTQLYEEYIIKNVITTLTQLKKGTYKSKGFYEFDIRERGKERHIKSVHISERTVQKCLCDYCLTPIFKNKLIYDSGATLKGKGLGFSVRRLKTHLHKYYRKYGNDGYVLKFDIHHFFDTIDHDILLNIVKKHIQDERLYNLYKHFVDCFGGECGIGLGSQISQLSALIYLNQLDHIIKDKLKMKFYGRYMDDGYIICENKEKLKECLRVIKEELKGLKLQLSEKKTQIIKLKNGFTFLKRRFILTKTGKIIIKPYKKNITRYKRKYKKLYKRNVDKKALEIMEINFKGYLKEFRYKDIYTRRIKICIDLNK